MKTVRRSGVPEPGLLAIKHFMRPTQRMLLILGHPRCGSAFAARAASSFGMEIGHEMMGRHGMASWMFAVDDLVAPFGRGYGLAPMNCSFKMVIQHLRDPFDAAPSIMIENKVGPSLVYRRQHIMDAFGFDITSLERPLDRAVASYLFWNKIVELRQPKFVFRIEKDLDRLGQFLHKEFGETVPLLQKRKMLEKANTFQEHFAKTGMSKPVVADADWSKLDETLAASLRQFCKIYGYEYRL
jgi:hypothetical protein